MCFTHGFPQPILDQNAVPYQPGIYVLIGERAQAEILSIAAP